MTRPPPPLLTLRNASFRPSPASRAIFPSTTFSLPSISSPSPAKWTVLGPSKSTFLSILRGSHHADPPNSRLYPLLATRNKWPQTALQLVSFGAGSSSSGLLRGGTGGDGYVSARYETLREEFDQTLREWLEASVERSVNPFEATTASSKHFAEEEERRNRDLLAQVARELKLGDLLDQAVMTLSNGQSRRARIAQALLKRPEALLLDDPFMGLDPPGKRLLSLLLDGKAESTPVVLGLRLQDPLPAWVTHVAYVEDEKLIASGATEEVIPKVREKTGRRIYREGEMPESAQGVVEKVWAGVGATEARKDAVKKEKEKEKEKEEGEGEKKLGEPLVEMENVRIAYYDKVILDNFNWTIRRGEKWCLFGPNGSGKTTLTSLLTSDHPLTYSLPIRHFGRPRLPTKGIPGISVFEIQSRIGITSPEIHSFFPRHLTLLRTIQSGYAETFLSPPSIPPSASSHLSAVLSQFRDLLPEGVSWGETQFGDVDLSTQRLALFLRATVPKRDLVVFDEAFSGMRKEVRERCFAFLNTREGWEEERQAMVVVSHDSEEVPQGMRKWIRLAEKGGREKAVFGEF